MENVCPGIMLEAHDVVTSGLACRWVTRLDAVRVLFGVKPRFIYCLGVGGCSRFLERK